MATLRPLGRSLTVDGLLRVLLLITILAVFVPFLPQMPGDNLDQSWVFGLNQATAQGLSFGRDIVFTYGPYASIFTKTYHPSTDFRMVGGGLYLAFSYWACLVLLMRGVPRRWILLLGLFIAGAVILRDTLFLSFPVVVGLASFKIIDPQKAAPDSCRAAFFYGALMFAPFGLLVLVKGSLIIPCCAIAALTALFCALNKRVLYALLCLIVPVISMFLFWIASGQAAVNLPDYLTSMAPMIWGYTEAMALNGNRGEVILYLVASAVLVLAILHPKAQNLNSRLFLAGIFSVFLFIAFKNGLVRHDAHALIAGTSILIAAFLLPFVVNSRFLLLVIALSLVSWGVIERHYMPQTMGQRVRRVVSTFSSAGKGFNKRIASVDGLKADYDSALRSLRDQASFPVLQGPTDIYSFNQSLLIASGNTWAPRPIFQSYSAYTPLLAEKNKMHLVGPQAPENVIIRVEPIDGRIPAMDDGASWPVLLVGYRPTGLRNDFLFLKTRSKRIEQCGSAPVTVEKHRLGEVVSIPPSDRPLFAEINIEPTWLGRFANTVFKPSQLQATFKLKNGDSKQYRLIAGMAKSGFVISPLIENTTEFGWLYGTLAELEGKVVRSLSIAPLGGKNRCWKDEYTIAFRPLPRAILQSGHQKADIGLPEGLAPQ
jgi:hypothetical protein